MITRIAPVAALDLEGKEGVFLGGWGVGGLVDSWPKTLCHRHRTGPRGSGLPWPGVDPLELRHAGAQHRGTAILESGQAARDRALDGTGIAHQFAVRDGSFSDLG